MENVNDNVAKIKEHPSPLASPFAPQRLRTEVDHLVFDFTRNGLNVTLIVPTGKKKNVGERKRA